MHFRPATHEDVPRLVAMQEVFFADAGDALDCEASERAMHELIDDASLGRLHVVEHDGGVAAYFVLGFGFSLEFGGRDAFVDELYVAPHARNQGIGSEALLVAEKLCAEAGVRALHLEVAHENHRARALYARNGYVAHERHLMTKRFT
jgi:ribosomal protein S18 acetylase RimI-like enzyme